MNRDEIPKDIAGVRRWLRDDEIRRGKRRPRTHRETEIWLAGLAERFGLRDDEPDGGSIGRTQKASGRQKHKKPGASDEA